MIQVDVILPIYKSEDIVYESIESVINQSYQYWHLYIVDDASNDNRLEEIKSKYADYGSKISYFQFEKNKRAAACRNYAIKNGNGKYIAFIDQDDLWKQDKLQLQVDYIENSKVDAVHGNIEFINTNSSIISKKRSKRENDTRRKVDWHNLSKVKLANQIFMVPNIRIISSMISRNLFEKIGGFKDEYFGGEDEIYWFEVAYHGKIGYLDSILIQRRIHDANTVTIYKADRLIGYARAIKYLKNNYYNDIRENYHIKERALYSSVINLLRREKKRLLVFKYVCIDLYYYPQSTILKIIKNESPWK
ncbi:MAG: glycosyltransferase [Methylococcales bacterium]